MAGKYAYAGMIILVVLLYPRFHTPDRCPKRRLRYPEPGIHGYDHRTTEYCLLCLAEWDIFLSGEPGEQPPVIEANQLNIVQDPPDGP